MFHHKRALRNVPSQACLSPKSCQAAPTYVVHWAIRYETPGQPPSCRPTRRTQAMTKVGERSGQTRRRRGRLPCTSLMQFAINTATRMGRHWRRYAECECRNHVTRYRTHSLLHRSGEGFDYELPESAIVSPEYRRLFVPLPPLYIVVRGRMFAWFCFDRYVNDV